jgi:hypothetical protein
MKCFFDGDFPSAQKLETWNEQKLSFYLLRRSISLPESLSHALPAHLCGFSSCSTQPREGVCLKIARENK